MRTDFQVVLEALLAHLQAKLGDQFPTMGRRVQHWSQVAAQPALFLRRIATTDTPDFDGLVSTTLECEIWIYCNAGQAVDAAPDDALAALEKQVRDSLAPGPTDEEDRFTLADQLAEPVYWCRIEGRADISPGDQGPQAIARLPVRITLP